MHHHLPFAYWLVPSFLLQRYLFAYYEVSTVLCHVLCKSAPAGFWFQTLNLSDSPFLPKAIFLNLAWWMASCWEQFPCSEPNSFCPILGEERWHFSLWDIILTLKGMWELDEKAVRGCHLSESIMYIVWVFWGPAYSIYPYQHYRC